MARKRSIAAILPHDHMNAAISGADVDPLKGCHVEDYLSTQASYRLADVETPMQAAFRGTVQDDDIARHRKFMREFYGDTEARREAWRESTDPGGHTFYKGEILE